MASETSEERWFRESPAAATVRKLYAMHLSRPQDPGAYGLLIAAIEEAKRHPSFPRSEVTMASRCSTDPKDGKRGDDDE